MSVDILGRRGVWGFCVLGELGIRGEFVMEVK